MGVKENLLPTMGIDGKRWSKEFCQRFQQCKVDDVLGWFCNAIMAGYDKGRLAGKIRKVGRSKYQYKSRAVKGA